ncbi:ribosomal subunit interface protein [Gemmiger sp. An120]|uniref:ribosome hibernation-promoting factor, HPF/YfiA family n=1 Tax=Gemmiger sp. An120 TaxID=1965549 RepID=UPI000B383D60|nr:ribosome-associated translation inhibitor RaiA [Gemmiger sp. An120]OUQ39717.1 ribosomal subunit interface protein [Gemmiger sp. An120]
MNIVCTGRKVSLKPSFTDKVQARLAKLDKFFSADAQAQVTVTVEKSGQTVEITVRDKGLILRAEKQAPRMEDALEDAVDLLTRRVVKNRKRLGDKLTRAVADTVPTEEPADEEPYQVIREKHFPVKPCTVEDAILDMNLLGHSFYLFRDAASDEIQLVYRRADGSYGVLIPER